MRIHLNIIVMKVIILNFYITVRLVCTCRCFEFLQFVTSGKKFSHSFLQTQKYLAVCYTLISS